MTGLRNAAAFERDLSELLAADGMPFAVVVVDVDSFGSFDRAHGHRAGEGLLRTVARAIEAATRQDDRAYRFLGDLFALLLTGEGQAHAERVADRVRDAFAEFAVDGGMTGAAVRIGTAHRPADGTDRDALLAAADAALQAVERQPAAQVSMPGSARESRLEFLLEAAETMLAARGRTEIAEAALERARAVLGTPDAFVALRDRGAMRVLAGGGPALGAPAGRKTIRRGEGLWGRVWETRRVLAAGAGESGTGPSVLLGVPLCFHDQVYGIVGAIVRGAPDGEPGDEAAGSIGPDATAEAEVSAPVPLDPLQLEAIARLGALAGAALSREAARASEH